MLFKKKFKKFQPDDTPAHVAFICDGNRRWARTRGLPTTAGHERGAKTLDDAVEYFINHGVSTVSFFLFSSENFDRDPKEVKFLMDLMAAELMNHVERAHQKNIRVKIIGRRDRFSAKLVKIFERSEKLTDENTAGTLVLALDYGGRDEILRAVNDAVTAGEVIDIDTFETFLDSGELPPIDFVVRTSGEQRISNFMLWKMAYAELMWYPKHWPALGNKDFAEMLGEYGKRKRRYGK